MTRCNRCRLLFCVCPAIPEVWTRTRVVIVRHAAERFKPSNTGRLAALALRNAELLDYGAKETRLDQSRLGGVDAWLLYPDGPATDPAWAPPRRLIVLDGTWAQARRMYRQIGALRRMPVLALSAPAEPLRRMRLASDPRRMSTLEAIARALGRLEGPSVEAVLIALHDAAVDSARRSARRRREDDPCGDETRRARAAT